MIPANPTDYYEDQLETFEDEPHFLHAFECRGYCDYACNSIGFDQAEAISILAAQGGGK
jgi:hypothetical protein